MKNFFFLLALTITTTIPSAMADNFKSIAYCVPLVQREPLFEIVVIQNPNRAFATIAFPRYSDIITSVDLTKVERESPLTILQGKGFSLIIDETQPASLAAGHFLGILDMDASVDAINPVTGDPMTLREFGLDCMTPNTGN